MGYEIAYIAVILALGSVWLLNGGYDWLQDRAEGLKRYYRHKGAMVDRKDLGLVPVLATVDRRFLGGMDAKMISELRAAGYSEEELRALEEYTGNDVEEWVHDFGNGIMRSSFNIFYYPTDPKQLNKGRFMYRPFNRAEVLALISKLKMLGKNISTRDHTINALAAPHDAFIKKFFETAKEGKRAIGGGMMPMTVRQNEDGSFSTSMKFGGGSDGG